LFVQPFDLAPVDEDVSFVGSVRSPAASRNNTDIPEPDTPVMQIISPLWSLKLISSSARSPSKLIETFRNSIAGS